MKTYEDGLNEAWNCAKRLILAVDNGGLPLDAIEEMFDCDLEDVFTKYSADEAVKKLKDWGESTYEVGDIVIHGNVRAVVTNIDKETDFFRIMYADGRSEVYKPQDMAWVKTGEHVNVQNIMEALK